jgi:hypothetical protein
MHDSSGWKDAEGHAKGTAEVMRRVYPYGCRDVVNINEPIALEGLGETEEDYRWFGQWGVEHMTALRSYLKSFGMEDVRVWGPSLSPGHKEDDFFEGYRFLKPYLQMLDGISVHNYFGPNFGFIGQPDAEWWIQRVERTHKLITSMGIEKPYAVLEWNRKVNRGDGNDIRLYAEQTKKYYQWINSLDYVTGAYTFLWCNTDPGFDDLTWEKMPGMVEMMSDGWDRTAELGGTTTVPVPEPTTTYATIGGLKVIDLRGKTTHTGEYPARPLAGIQQLVVHHSGVDVDSTAESMAQYHVNTEGWPGLAYAFVVHWDGTIEYTQDIGKAGYTVALKNPECLSICLPGNWSLRQPPEAQLAATKRLLAALRIELGRKLPIVGHKDVAAFGWATECPGSTWAQYKEKIMPDAIVAPPTIDKAKILAALDTLWGISLRMEKDAKQTRDYIVAIKKAAGLE